MSDPARAVFLSYASQDAEAARALVEALRASGVEVWFDQAELAGGDAWDTKIRGQIAACALFVPVISGATQARREGYFRIEWKLAAQRTHAMADGTPFLLPVLIDATRDDQALVPAEFKAVQWTRLSESAGASAFAARVKRVLERGAADSPSSVRDSAEKNQRTSQPAHVPVFSKKGFRVLVGVTLALLLAGGWAWVRSAGSARPPPDADGTPAWSEAGRLAAQAYALTQKSGFTREDLAAAEDLARRATELEPEGGRPWSVRAWVQAAYLMRNWDAGLRRSEETQRLANRALALTPHDADALNALFFVLVKQGAVAEAESVARRAVASSADNYRSRLCLSGTLRIQGRRDEARDVLREAVNRFPDQPLVRYELALSYTSNVTPSAADIDEALAQLDAALRIQPFASALVLKARTLVVWRGDLSGMRAALDGLDQLPLADRTEDRSVHIALWGSLLERSPERALAAAALTARTYFEDATLQSNAMVVKAFYTGFAQHLAGRVNLARTDWLAAEALLRQRLREHPEDLGDQLQLAITLAWLGQEDEARALLVAAGARVGEKPTVGLLILQAQAYAGLGEAAESVALLKQILARSDNGLMTRHRLRLEPWWDKIRARPEFVALLTEPPARVSAMPSALVSLVAPAVDEKSLAVLPLENLSPDPENAFFTEGMHSEIIATLGRIPDLRVVSRGSALAFKNSPLSPPEIAEKLGVANLVSGSVRRAGERLRIALELRRARDDALLWSQTFDRELKDVFAIQSEIAAEVARLLQVRAAKGSFGGARYTTRNLKAYDLFLRAYALFEQDIRSLPKQIEAITLAEDAISLDPEFATAANLLAHANQRAFSSATDPLARLRFAEQCKRWGEETARLLPGGAGDGALSIYYSQIELDYVRAQKLAENAVRALPDDAQSYNYLGIAYGGLGKTNEALEIYQKALALDPAGRTYLLNAVGHANRLRRTSLVSTFLRVFPSEERSAPINGLAMAVFIHSGALPVDLTQMSALQKAPWLKRARNWSELLALCDNRLASDLNPVERLALLCYKIDALRRLGRVSETEAPAVAALSVAQDLQSVPEIGPSRKQGWLADALACAGRKVEALAAIDSFVEATTAQQFNVLDQRRIRKAELLADLGETDASLTLIATLLREPSGLTVPILRVDPVWDNLRADPRFQALLDDPANSAPL